MSQSKTFELFHRWLYKAEALLHKNRFFNRKLRACNPPEDGASEIVTNLIVGRTTKNTRSGNVLMHSTGSSPTSSDSLEPTNPQKKFGSNPSFFEQEEPISGGSDLLAELLPTGNCSLGRKKKGIILELSYLRKMASTHF